MARVSESGGAGKLQQGDVRLRVVSRRDRRSNSKAVAMACAHCGHPLEYIDQNRRFGSWLASFFCPRCRSEYFYAYTWGTLLRRA